jgi:E3 ubiquitin-protein ligase RNF11
MPMYHPTPNVSRPASQLTEEEQVKIAKRIGLIQHLPTGTYDGCKKNREYDEPFYLICVSYSLLLIIVVVFIVI